MSTALFECQNLLKRYGDNTVVNDVSFSIAPGECLGVIGPNGAGKTTTLRMCLGLVRPDEGRIEAFGLHLPEDTLAIKQRLGVVSQFDTLDPDFTCAENLRVYGRYFGLSRQTLDARIGPLLTFAALEILQHVVKTLDQVLAVRLERLAQNLRVREHEVRRRIGRGQMVVRLRAGIDSAKSDEPGVLTVKHPRRRVFAPTAIAQHLPFSANRLALKTKSPVSGSL